MANVFRVVARPASIAKSRRECRIAGARNDHARQETRPGAGGAPVITDIRLVVRPRARHPRPPCGADRQAGEDLAIPARGACRVPRRRSARRGGPDVAGIRGGDELVIAGFFAGPRRGAVAELARVVRDPGEDAGAAPCAVAPAVPARAADGTLRGVIASRGFAVGRSFYLPTVEIAVPEAGRGVEAERAALANARATVRSHARKRARVGGGPPARSSPRISNCWTTPR